MAAFGSSTTTTTPAWDPFRVTITIGGAPTGAGTAANATVYVYAARAGEPMGGRRPHEAFVARALTALERRLAREQAATALRVTELRRRRLLKARRPPLPVRRVARCCSLAGSWRVRH